MTVYIEYAIIDNLVIDSLLLFAVVKTLRLTVKPLPIMFSAVLGTTFAVVLPLFNLPTVVILIVKIALAPTMCLIAVRDKKRFFPSILLFLAYTFVLGGVLIALFFGGKDFTVSGGTLSYATDFPIGLPLLGVSICTYLLGKLINYLRSLATQCKGIYPCKLHLLDKTFALNGYADSGNLLEYKGLPVVFLTDKAVLNKVGRAVSCALASGKKVGLCTVNYATVNGEGNVKALPCTISLKGKTHRIMLAMTRKRDVFASMILNARFFGGVDEDFQVNNQTI